jgi:Phospholipase_D-nuclease N-terminal
VDFWEVVWAFFVGSVLFAYLFVLFEVVRDLLRDRSSAGWVKALWLLALIFVPVLTCIAYVLVRGGTGSGSGGDAVRDVQARQAQYERSVAGPSPTQEIAHAKSMWDTGVIDRAEFDALKMKALS